ncbi:MAG: hypothetical protein RLZZ28_1573 [Bacteroidota bacterium]|jgi:AcrR family transcriptional regulator
MIMEQQERIVLKAHELFMRYGIRSVSMDEVANHLGMSKKTIYQYYTDKDALVDDVIEIETRRNEDECKMHQLKSENALHEVFLATDMVMELMQTINPAVLFDLEKYHPRAFKKFSDHKNKFLYKVIFDNLEAGKNQGLYRLEINSDILSRFRLTSMFVIFNQEYFPHGKYSFPELIAEITDSFLYGMTTPKGQKLIEKYKQQRQKQ